ncbi:hypothetical protein [Virgibacillus salexigens]|nr:hypothetical protein [Virgibacillus salexigens]
MTSIDYSNRSMDVQEQRRYLQQRIKSWDETSLKLLPVEVTNMSC